MIRKIANKDFNSIRNLVLQVHKLHVENRPDIYNDVDPFDEKYFNFILNDKNTLSLVYEINDKIIAFCVATLREVSKNPLMKDRRVAFMDDLCVDKSYRKQGIGKLLFNEMKCIAKDNGATNLELMVWSFNETAIDFYKDMGMKNRSIIMEENLLI